jgi:uncharacterized integral membrane protein
VARLTQQGGGDRLSGRARRSADASTTVGNLPLIAGRMARFNGPRQRIAVWLIGLLVTIVLAVAGAEDNVLSGLQLPRIPVGEGSPIPGGLIALAAVSAGTLLAAIAGGNSGTHFHRQVDRVGLA